MPAEPDLSGIRLDGRRLDDYLRRIGLDRSPIPDRSGLGRLHLAHATSVPFENLDIHMGRAIRLDPDALYDKIVTHRRGGFCYEQNLLFAAALLGMGFRVALLSARVWNGKGAYGPPFDHMALRVAAGDETLLADVGFGECFLEPIEMDGRWCPQRNGAVYRLVEAGDEMRLEHRAAGRDDPVVDYALDPTARGREEFEPMCRFHQISPASSFTRKWVCSLATPEGRVTLNPGRLVETSRGLRAETEVSSREAVQATLRTRFGMESLDLPEGFPLETEDR
jgi:N-hydroxyarylamine O-acetyltransferase